MALLLFLTVCLVLLAGYPVAFTLGGVSLLFAGIGILTGTFEANLLLGFPNRLFDIVSSSTLLAVPLFIFMGVVLERSKLAEDLLANMALACRRLPMGLGVSVILVGTLLAASTGIVGATVVTMGLMSLPIMLKQGYPAPLASGLICATGTLGQIIPPSIALILLNDVIASAYQQSNLNAGVFDAAVISAGDFFIAAMVPGLMLVAAYLLYLLLIAKRSGMQVVGASDDSTTQDEATKSSTLPSAWQLLLSIAPTLLLIIAVLGSIMKGIATPTEAAAIGAVCALVLAALRGRLSFKSLSASLDQSFRMNAMVFFILIGASLFSLTFRGFGGEALIEAGLHQLPGGGMTALIVVMLCVFVMGFILDFIEITFIVIPLVGPTLLAMGFDPIWLGIVFALNLQTSFLTPPFGFSLFYLRGVAPASLATTDIYRGVLPFIGIQVLVLGLVILFPGLVVG